MELTQAQPNKQQSLCRSARGHLLRIGRLKFAFLPHMRNVKPVGITCASLSSHYALIFTRSECVAACLQVGHFPVDPAARGFSSTMFGISIEVP